MARTAHVRARAPYPACMAPVAPLFHPYRRTRTRQHLPCTSAGNPAPHSRASHRCPHRSSGREPFSRELSGMLAALVAGFGGRVLGLEGGGERGNDYLGY